MAKVHIESAGGGGALAAGNLQLENGVAMDATLRAVADQANTTSPLELSTGLVSVTSTLQIKTDDVEYIDAEGSTGGNRFTVSRAVGSQVVNVDFASNPTLGTEQVGAIRTYQDGVSLSDSISFLKNGNVGIGTSSPAGKVEIVSDGGGQLLFSRYGGQPQINIRRSQGTFAAPIAVGSGASSVLNFQNYDGTSFGTSAQIQSVPETQTPTAKGASLALNVVPSGTTSLVGGLVVSSNSVTPGSVSITTNFSAASARLSIWGSTLSPTLPYFNILESGGGELLKFSNAGNLLVGSGSPSDTAKLSVKGSGSTSATTSLLVQSSSGTELVKVRDDGYTTIGAGNQGLASVNATFSSYLISNGTAGNVFGTFTSFNSSAIVQCDSTTKGFLPPRMTTAQKNAISSPAAGLMVYDTDLNKLCVYTTAWETITSV